MIYAASASLFPSAKRSSYFWLNYLDLYNNIFFLYDGRYTYYDRLHRRGHFDSHRPHYREYRHHKNNDWNRSRNYRNDREPVYGYYYEKQNKQKQFNNQKENYQPRNDNRNYKQNKDNNRRDEFNHR